VVTPHGLPGSCSLAEQNALPRALSFNDCRPHWPLEDLTYNDIMGWTRILLRRSLYGLCCGISLNSSKCLPGGTPVRLLQIHRPVYPTQLPRWSSFVRSKLRPLLLDIFTLASSDQSTSKQAKSRGMLVQAYTRKADAARAMVCGLEGDTCCVCSLMRGATNSNASGAP
jgi:hypothetical protein